MEENAYQLSQHELEVNEVMRVHREERVFPSHYPCSEFMNATGILQDFQTLLSNAGLEHFIEGEPPQYVKLTMFVVQDFRFSWSVCLHLFCLTLIAGIDGCSRRMSLTHT
jgi:hypothetical protein